MLLGTRLVGITMVPPSSATLEMMRKGIVTICSSADFYQKVVDLQDALEKAGFISLIPLTAKKMKQSGDYEASHYRTWLSDAKDYHKKTTLMRTHFDEVARGDVVLVVNEEKHGIANYIGGNVLMEMALGFYLNKPIFILNDIPEESSFLEEILAFEPIVLHGDLDKLTDHRALKGQTQHA
jgi:hypothetical protein